MNGLYKIRNDKKHSGVWRILLNYVRNKGGLGDAGFYTMTLKIAVPIMVQSGITSFVNMLDNVMVGHLGTDPMSGVAIVNQLMFVFNLCIFGGLAGISIFTSQFCGKGDEEGIRYTFRQMLCMAAFLTLLGTLILAVFGRDLIMIYLRGDEGMQDAARTLAFATSYLRVMFFGLVPFALTQVYSGVLRATGITVIPMRAGLIAVAVNLVGNYILIYGKAGAPALGVAGAAAATCLSRFVEMAYVIAWTHRHREENRYITGVYRRLYDVPASLNAKVIRKAIPLLANEALWSLGVAVLAANYAYRGLSVVAAQNISQTIGNVFNVSFIALGSAAAIILGQELGAGEKEKARKDADRLAVFAVSVCTAVGAVLFVLAPLFPRIYNTTDDVRALAGGMIRVTAACMPILAYLNTAYFTIRSGGRTYITFLFDAAFCWLVPIPVSYALTHFTQMPVLWIWLCVSLLDLIKCGIGFVMVKKGIWIRDLTVYGQEERG